MVIEVAGQVVAGILTILALRRALRGKRVEEHSDPNTFKKPCRFTHEAWCADNGYEECTCDLDKRIADHEVRYREPDAVALPNTVARYR